MYYSNILVFKEITTPTITLFVHYKVADEESKDRLAVDRILTESEHYELLAKD